ncbi:MAG: 16S rRNA (guanine(527)-N(7))-methyltransferase RsmG [Pirellula sp.]|jgi:16S rRNA (guanine527-N7)-methyltransferase|nr:16S rRNA (guanine(527)-N(7))-methyltransferase RsmG [Pirellula sp.]
MSNIDEEGDKAVSLPVFTGNRLELDQRLRETAIALQIDVPNECWEPIADYCSELWDWNTRVNLTRHTTPELFVKRDLLDSWHVCKLLEQNEEVLDVGTGSGVPGILIAILRPDTQVTLCDSVAKKAKVVEQIANKLKLKIPVYGQSVQKVLDDFRYDTLTSRAVGPLVRLCNWLDPYWHTFGRMLAIKGPKWPEERGEARHRGLLKKVELRRLVSYPMPDTNSESSILQLKRM